MNWICTALQLHNNFSSKENEPAYTKLLNSSADVFSLKHQFFSLSNLEIASHVSSADPGTNLLGLLKPALWQAVILGCTDRHRFLILDGNAFVKTLESGLIESISSCEANSLNLRGFFWG